MEVRFSQAAIADLRKIQTYIGQFNPTAAERITRRLRLASERLGGFSEMGRPGPDGTRELSVVHPYVVVYRVRANRVRILRIWHSAQDRSGS